MRNAGSVPASMLLFERPPTTDDTDSDTRNNHAYVQASATAEGLVRPNRLMPIERTPMPRIAGIPNLSSPKGPKSISGGRNASIA